MRTRVAALLALAVASGATRAEADAWADAPCQDVGAPSAEAEDSEAPLPAIALKDTLHVLGAPLRWKARDWVIFGSLTAGVVILGAAADDKIRAEVRGHPTDALDEVTRIAEPFGLEYSWAVLGAYGIAGFVFGDPEARDIAVDGAMAGILVSGIVAPVLKGVVGRGRPNQGKGSDAFDPFSGDQSFPSSHAAQAFAVASVIGAHSDRVWVNVAAYTLAGLVGFSRIYHDDHWASDVAAGALIGTFTGRAVVALNRRLRRKDSRVEVLLVPVVSRDERGATLLLRF